MDAIKIGARFNRWKGIVFAVQLAAGLVVAAIGRKQLDGTARW